MLRLSTLLLFLWISGIILAETNQSDHQTHLTPAEFEATLKYQRGKIVLPNQIATLNVSQNFRYLDSKDAERVLVMAWGNPPGVKTLGMLFPTEVSPVSKTAWGVVITYDEDGHVADADADSINYTELLQQMKETVTLANQERKKRGYEVVELVGWAKPPYYDKSTHKMYWAKELRFGEESTSTLNYNIRILGRKGVLVLNAVSGIEQLNLVEKFMPQVLAFTNFNSGYRYEDFDSTKDKVADYGLAALVAGGAAAAVAKTGLFTKLIALLIAAKKFVILIVVFIGTFILNLFKRKSVSK